MRPSRERGKSYVYSESSQGPPLEGPVVQVPTTKKGARGLKGKQEAKERVRGENSQAKSDEKRDLDDV